MIDCTRSTISLISARSDLYYKQQLGKTRLMLKKLPYLLKSVFICGTRMNIALIFPKMAVKRH